MCFTVKITADALRLENRYGVKAGASFRKNEKPQSSGFDHPLLPMVLQDAIETCRWGLIPEWVRDREQALEIRNKTLNARSETAMEKASFKKAILGRRCIIPVESFFETQHRGKAKIRYEIKPAKGEFLSLAGIWETWVSPQSQTPVSGFSILTTAANPLMAEIHNTKLRMPVVIEEGSIGEWLDPNLDKGRISELCLPYPDEWLRAECLENFFL